MNDTLKNKYEKLSVFYNAKVINYHLDHEDNKATIEFMLDQNKEPEIITIEQFNDIVQE